MEMEEPSLNSVLPTKLIYDKNRFHFFPSFFFNSQGPPSSILGPFFLCHQVSALPSIILSPWFLAFQEPVSSSPHVQILRFQGQRKRLLFVGKWQNRSSGGRSKLPSGHGVPTALLLGAPTPRCKLVPVPLALCPNDASSLGPRWGLPDPLIISWCPPPFVF